jgi:predicted phage terminase large subunit-like protein
MDMSRYKLEELAELAVLLERRREFEQLSEAEQQRLEYRAHLEASPAEFFKAAWDVLEPGRPLVWSPHYELISEWLLKVWRRQCLRLIINVPPRTAKSTEGTICFPAWGWARDPRHRFLTASYSRDLSREHSSKRRNLIESAWYKSLWPIAFSDDTNRADQYKNEQQGEMIATSVGATGTGRGGDTLILDDGLSADQAQSEAERKTAHAWFREIFRTRLNDPATGAIVVIEQRTHHEDITGWLLKNEPGQWTQVVIPLVQDAKTDLEMVFPITGRKWERKIGDVLQPERHTPAVVSAQMIHRRTFETQAQQRPSPEGGDICKREWWTENYYRAVPAEFDQVLDSWDLTFKDAKDSDFVAGFKVGVKGAHRYFLDCIHGRMGFTASKDAVKRLRVREPVASRVLIEDKANGPAVIDSLRSSVPGLIPVEPTGSKFARAVAATGDIEAGNCHLPDPEIFPQHRIWVDTLIEEWAIFPNGANDDMVDGSDQAINYTRSAMGNIADYYRERAAAVEAAKKPHRVLESPKEREWSEALRTVRMGILPPGDLPVDEINDWITLCEEMDQHDAAEVARGVLKQAEGGK